MKELAVFGSILRNDFGPASDVDFLVTWASDARRGIVDRLAAREELSQLVGRRVDLVDRQTIERSRNWIRRQDIISSAEVIHAASLHHP